MMRPRSVVSHGDATIYNFMFGAVIVRDGVVLGVSSGINQAKEDLDTEVNPIEPLNVTDADGLCTYCLEDEVNPIEPLNVTDADGLCTYCLEEEADPGYDRCTACRTWRDEEWCEANGHPHGVPIDQAPSS